MSYGLAGDGRNLVGGVRDRFEGLTQPRSAKWRFGAEYAVTGLAAYLASGQQNQHWSSEPLSGTTSGWFGSPGDTVLDLSMSCWIKLLPESTQAATRGYFGIYWGISSNTSGIGFMSNNAAGQVKFHVGSHSTATANAVASGMVSGVWYHLTGTWTSGTLRVYLNGEVQADGGTRAVAHVISGGTVTLGVGAVSGGTGFATNGFGFAFVRDACIWNRELTSGEALTLYNGGTPYDVLADAGLSSGLRAYYRCGDGQGDCPEQIADISGNPSGFPLLPQAFSRADWPALLSAP